MTDRTVIATRTAGLDKSGGIVRIQALARSASPRTRLTPSPPDEPGCNPMTTRTSARTRIITFVAAATLLAVGGCASDPAAAFAAAYSSGDTPTACTYASGKALEQLNKDGWCQQKQQWNVQYWQTGTCTLPTGEISFNYETSSEIDGQRGFEVAITGGGPEVYKVTTFIKRNNTSPSLCGIYATRSSAG